MHRLLSDRGQYKYSMYIKSNPESELVGPPAEASSIAKPELLMPTVTKSVQARSPKSLLGNYTIGRLDTSYPTDSWQANRNKVQAANPHLKLPGAQPGVKGVSLGFRF